MQGGDLRSLVESFNGHNGIGVNFKCDLNLRNSLGGRWDTSQIEFTKKVVELGLSAFTLVHLDSHRLLIISRSRKAMHREKE